MQMIAYNFTSVLSNVYTSVSPLVLRLEQDNESLVVVVVTSQHCPYTLFQPCTVASLPLSAAIISPGTQLYKQEYYQSIIP